MSHFIEETKSSLHPNNKEIKPSLEYKIPEHVNNLTERVADQIKEAVAQAPEKVERISEIVNEELSGMRKRLESFPEKSKKIAPKFEKFRALIDRGGIPYTIWNFQYFINTIYTEKVKKILS